MRYLFLLWGDEAAELGLSPDERRSIVEAHGRFIGELTTDGRVVVGEAVGPSADSVIVDRDGGSISDGPFAETKEQLGGFYLIDCRDRDEAVALALRIPASPGLRVEIRAIPS
jgi:hypothetical protein